MKKILHIISSPRGEASASIKLGNAIVDRIVDAYPGSTVKETNLVTSQFPHLEEAHLVSFFTPSDSRTPEQLAAVKSSDTAVADLKEADIIVIGAPLYNFGIHSSLKAWIDHITRKGISFAVTDTGAEGLITGKKVYVAFSAGWVYADGPMQPADFVTPYLKHMLGFLGMTDVQFVRAEGLMIPGIQETAMDKATASIEVA
jgi:FMN-dependent NADH-azoreductase